MSIWRVYNAVDEGEADGVLDYEFPWYVALDADGMTFEIAARFESYAVAVEFLREHVACAALDGA